MNTCHLKLHTLFSRDEVIARLRDSMDHESPNELTLKSAFRGTHEVIGSLQDNKLQLRRRIPYSSLFQPVLHAELSQEGQATVIDGTVTLGRGATAFYLTWLIALGMVVSVIFVATLVKFIQGTALPGSWTGFCVPVLVVIFRTGHRWYSGRVVDRDAAFLAAHLRQQLNIAGSR